MPRTRAERKVRQFQEEPLRPGDPRLRAKGRLLIIGGKEDKEGDKRILRELADLVGDGKLVVATLASDSPDEVWETYEPVLRGLGIPHVHHLNLEDREDASSVRSMRILEGATAVFFTGGDQLKITSMIGDTPVFSRIHEILIEGGTIAGTSAGASVMSETMMVGGNGSSSYRINEGLRLAPGFGFAKDMVIDQHFAERGRVGRLLGVVGQNPRVIGVGIDENTAILMRPHRDFKVIGEGAVTVLDGKSVTYSNIAEDETGDTMSVFGVTLHVLGQGDAFDLRTRKPRDLPSESEEEVEHASAGSSNGNGNGKRRRG
jgi:cyanophycinase